MVTKDNPDEKGRVNVGPLAVNKETVADLTEADAQKVQGGININRSVNVDCPGGATASPTFCVKDACATQNCIKKTQGCGFIE